MNIKLWEEFCYFWIDIVVIFKFFFYLIFRENVGFYFLVCMCDGGSCLLDRRFDLKLLYWIVKIKGLVGKMGMRMWNVVVFKLYCIGFYERDGVYLYFYFGVCWWCDFWSYYYNWLVVWSWYLLLLVIIWKGFIGNFLVCLRIEIELIVVFVDLGIWR